LKSLALGLLPSSSYYFPRSLYVVTTFCLERGHLSPVTALRRYHADGCGDRDWTARPLNALARWAEPAFTGRTAPKTVCTRASNPAAVTVIGLDDTDSREAGLCTTYVAAQVATELERSGATVQRRLLLRCNPAVEHKTRGNAALAVHTDADPTLAREVLATELDAARTEDPRTNPGGVVAPVAPGAVPEPVTSFADSAVRDLLDIETARELAEAAGFATLSAGNGRGLIGALAAVGAWAAFEAWTYECISYRERERWGTAREVYRESVFAAATDAYPAAWDTVDRVEDHAVCVPRTPCPILHAIRGDDPAAVRNAATAIEAEPVSDRALFVTNQGTDAHLRHADGVEAIRDGRAYRLDATVAAAPDTRAGGHVHLSVSDGDAGLDCIAFEPTKRFRDRVRALHPGDAVTVCGEVADGTLKLEKFALRERVETTLETPDCPDCGRSMASAGRDQGYRCRDCGTAAPGKIEQSIDRAIEPGWYEVPPCARRHVAKPLVRGGFDAPTHPEA
jgi:tRNA(Ile2)-agmatinylcytidine synthase